MGWDELVYICCRAAEGKIMDSVGGDWRWTALVHRPAMEWPGRFAGDVLFGVGGVI